MKKGYFSTVAFAFILAAGLVLPGSAVAAEDIKVEDVSFHALIDQLFGTTENPGLLDGDKEFHLHAENIILTSEEAQAFFVPTEANTSDLADLITAAESIRGTELKLRGLLNGGAFELKLSGKQIKLEGIALTDAELDALVQELQGISGLREAKINALVDGEAVVVKIENQPGRVKIENRDRPNPGRAEARVERPAKVEKIEKSEHVERLERVQRPERVERPERGGPGR
jgi:hypothetical protein